ncbi:MAG TPA: hypothetical protein VGM01_10540 [Ktedonobacteraceae bacterium]
MPMSMAIIETILLERRRHMTNQERIKILEMVASGKITVEQADQLIETLNAKSLADAEKQTDQGQRTNEYSQEMLGKIRGARKTGEADYIRALREAGLTDLTVEQIVSLKSYKVSPEYIRALRETELTDLTVKQIISLNMYKISPAYIRALKETGLTDLTAEQVISLNMYKVGAEYIRALRGTGLTDLTVEQIISLKIYKVDPSFSDFERERM